MVKRRRVRFWLLSGRGISDTMLLGGCFLVGSLLGTLLVARFGSSVEDTIGTYLNAWALQLAESGSFQPAWLKDLLHNLRFPVLALLLGFVPLGVVGIPLLFLFRGLLISFTAASFLKVYAYQGLLAAGLLYGPAEAVSVLALFAAGAFAFSGAMERASGSLPARRKAVQSRAYAPALLMTCAVLAVSLLQSAASPWTMKVICALVR